VSAGKPPGSRGSAGLLLWRRRDGRVEVLLAHPGGPFYARKDAGAWSLPKGLPEPGEEPLAAARREFAEETGFAPPADAAAYASLGEVRQAGGKVVTAWAFEGDCDPERCVSTTFEMEWPPGSGRRATFPEVDRCRFFGLAEARAALNPAQAPFVDRLEAALAGGGAANAAAPGVSKGGSRGDRPREGGP
jgi:predicted NUDIX family NTP pyrophosphohydrolase